MPVRNGRHRIIDIFETVDEARPLDPPLNDRDWLLDTLEALIRTGGSGLVLAPFVLPIHVLGPELLQPMLLGVRRLLQRLARYAGLGGITIEVTDAVVDAEQVVGLTVAVSLGAPGIERTDHTLRISAVAAVWSGLGVLAINAS